MADDDKLNPEKSPSVVELKKKRTRRINNMPLIVAIIIVTAIMLVMGGVMLKRSSSRSSSNTEVTQGGRGSAKLQAKDVIGGIEGGGLIAPKEKVKPPEHKPAAGPAAESLPKPVVNAPPPPMLITAPVPPPPAQVKPPVDTERLRELARIRQKRLKEMEAAVNSPLDVKVNASKLKAGEGIQSELSRVEQQIASLSGSNTTLSYEERLAMVKAATEGSAQTVDYSTAGDLSRMKPFTSTAAQWEHASDVSPPSTLKILRTGSVIPATLVSGINSDLPGQIIGQVSQNVYDTPTGKYLLIPQGSRLVGEYASNIQYGQSRLFAVWQRVVFPDGKTLELGAMPASTGAGYSGFRDRVNNHYFRIFGSAIMMSAILAGVEMTQESKTKNSSEDTTRMSDALSEALGQSLGGVMAEMLSKNMSIAPTLEIRPGFVFNIMVVKDLTFGTEYKAFDYVSAR